VSGCCAFPGGSHAEISAPLVTALLDEAASLRSALIETDRDWALPQRGSALREQIACELDAVVACALQIGLASSTSRDAVRAVLQSLAEGLGSAPELAHICDAAMRGAQLLSPQTPSMLRQIFASPRAVDAFIERVVCGSESELVDAAVGQEEEEEEGGDSSNSERQLEALSGSCDPIHITCSFRVDASSVQPEEEGKRAIVVSVTATNVSGGSAKSLALALAIQGDLHPAGASSASRQLATLPAGATTRWDVRLLAHSVGWCSLQVLVELNGAVVGSTRRANVGGDGEEEEEDANAAAVARGVPGDAAAANGGRHVDGRRADGWWASPAAARRSRAARRAQRWSRSGRQGPWTGWQRQRAQREEPRGTAEQQQAERKQRGTRAAAAEPAQETRGRGRGRRGRWAARPPARSAVWWSRWRPKPAAARLAYSEE